MKYLGTLTAGGGTTIADDPAACRRQLADLAGLDPDHVVVSFRSDPWPVYEYAGAAEPFATMREVLDESEQRLAARFADLGDIEPSPGWEDRATARFLREQSATAARCRLVRGAVIVIAICVLVALIAIGGSRG